MSQFWRQWLRSPKHGLSRGVAVHGSPGFQDDHARLANLLSDCRVLRTWVRYHGVALNDRPDSLATLDHILDLADDATRRRLETDAALYLGTVIVGDRLGARWQVWPNGHPVIRLASGQELDVVAAVSNRISDGQSALTALYADTAADRAP